ncbi:hypothetical protein SAY87_000134 [Trapa incisa]|uniref:PGG domain-containing protein n=1 Tax=Trapa incisa TaxID=236973 RepID=A0AAN7JGY1_9MYRT|nr:hypothetical protein SAY87_000134 [Trapa incisa]
MEMEGQSDQQLHSGVREGDLGKIREILEKIGDDGESKKKLLLCRNSEGETPLYVAAEIGNVAAVAEILRHSDIESASAASRNGFDPFHIAAKLGHVDVLKELMRAFPSLVLTTDPSCSTALHTAAAQGHVDVVRLLLETDSNLAKIARNNGKTALHSAARMGHLQIVKLLLAKDPKVGFRTDRKGQTALHMAVKGQNEDIVRELSSPDPSAVNVEDNKGNTALHIAARKGRSQIIQCLLSVEGISTSKMNKAGETPLDIAEKLGSQTASEVVSALKEAGATNSKDQPTNPAKQLKQTVSDIKHDVQSQLLQTRQTGAKVQKIAKRLKKLHISGLNNAINSATVVAVLIATVAFAAIFTVPGQYVDTPTPGDSLGQARIARQAAFMIFFVFDSLALFISLAVVVVQTSVVVIEQKAKRQLVFVINKLMWLACIFISISFISLSYVVVGTRHRWLAAVATLIGGSIMLTTIGSMCYCVVMHRLEEKKLRCSRQSESRSRSYSMMSVASDHDILNADYKRMYAV